MDTEYLIKNIGRNALPHYELLSAMRVIVSDLREMNGKCFERENVKWVRVFEDEEKWFEKSNTGYLWWKKYYFQLSEQGSIYLKHYCGKVAMITKSILRLYNDENKWKDVDELREDIYSEVTSHFRTMADYVIPTSMDVVRAAVELHGGYGYSKEFKVERLYRAAIGSAVIATNLAINKSIVGASLVR